MKKLYNLESECNGCSACYAVCPRKCISFVKNQEGFIFPDIDSTKCIECNMCRKVCSQRFDYGENKEACFMAAISLDKSINNSSSGGVFPLLAMECIKNNGIVFGTEMNEKHIAYQRSIRTLEKISCLQGSKYVFSDSLDTYQETKTYLDMGKEVLYVGRPCQIAGLKNYLGKTYERLCTVDFICHGVPSEKMFLKYIDYLEKKHGGELIDINFRNKEKYGWSITLSYDIKYKGNKVKRYFLPQRISEYFTGFLTGATLRESCYKCKFSKLNHQADITLGDYWGYDPKDIKHDVSRGLSLVIINNIKGREVINKIDGKLYLTYLSKEKVLKSLNKNLLNPTDRHSSRNKIYSELDQYGFEKIAKEYLRDSNYRKEFIKSKLPVVLLKRIQQILRIIRNNSYRL